MPRSSTRKPALADALVVAFPAMFLEKRQDALFVRRPALGGQDRTCLRHFTGTDYRPGVNTRTNASSRLATSERMTGTEGSALCEEVFMTLKPFVGGKVGVKVRHVIWTAVPLSYGRNFERTVVRAVFTSLYSNTNRSRYHDIIVLASACVRRSHRPRRVGPKGARSASDDYHLMHAQSKEEVVPWFRQ